MGTWTDWLLYSNLKMGGSTDSVMKACRVYYGRTTYWVWDALSSVFKFPALSRSSRHEMPRETGNLLVPTVWMRWYDPSRNVGLGRKAAPSRADCADVSHSSLESWRLARRLRSPYSHKPRDHPNHPIEARCDLNKPCSESNNFMAHLPMTPQAWLKMALYQTVTNQVLMSDVMLYWSLNIGQIGFGGQFAP